MDAEGYLDSNNLLTGILSAAAISSDSTLGVAFAVSIC